MGLVQYALKFRATFYVIAILILVSGIAAIVAMPKDALPNVNIPVVTVVWTYTGLDAPDMEQKVTTYTEFSLSNNVNGIKRMESTTLQGVTITRIYFQDDVSIDLAITQVAASTNSIRAVLPPGIQPPVVMRFSASSVPVIQLALSSEAESERQLYDYGQYRLRQTLTTVPGSTLPSPYGGAPRQIMIDLDLHALQARGLTPSDVTTAINAQNLTLPSGLAKIGSTQFVIRPNSSPTMIDQLNEIPVKMVGGAPVLMRDIAFVRDGSPPQQNIVRSDGKRAVLMSVLKNGAASTLQVVNTVKGLMPDLRAAAPKDMTITELFDQSVFVSGAIDDVVREAIIAAVLTGVMILVFLGSWRSTLIVLISIPLSILTSLTILGLLGHTINVMTLGGLALAVGILVDDATVAIENTYRLFEEKNGFREAVVEGSAGVAKPALVSTLSICCAFVSVLLLTDAPKYIFTPQALAVVFAMLASYLLSRTLVPILVDVFVAKEFERKYGDEDEDKEGEKKKKDKSRFERIQARIQEKIDDLHEFYGKLVRAALRRRWITLAVVGVVMLLAAVMLPFVGEDYFPAVDAGQMTLHVRARPGLRIEEAERLFQQVEDTIREIIPQDELGPILDNIGLPASNYNFAFGSGTFVAYDDGQVLITLKEGHGPTAGYMRTLRHELNERFPDSTFYFEAADIITQILQFGVPATIDIQVSGHHGADDLKVAQQIVERLRGVRGAVDVHLQQIIDAPEFFVPIDRLRAIEQNLTEQQAATALNVSLSGSFQVQPNFWADQQSGIAYQVWVQTPEYRNDSLEALQNTPLAALTGGINGPATGLLSNIADFKRGVIPAVITHQNTQPSFDIYASVQDRDLGGVESEIEKIVDDVKGQLQAPDKIQVRGEIENKDSAFRHIELGLGIALLAVYLMMVVNFQDWGDPLVVLLALPLAFCGIVASLFITGTSFSIPSLMGAIISVGVASANSILLVTFAREHRLEHNSTAEEAAIAAGETRLRPVLMTAGAMFVGLLPMAIGIGQGSEQNAAIARAVLGGIAIGTCSTLIFVPFLYSVLRKGEAKPVEDYLKDEDREGHDAEKRDSKDEDRHDDEPEKE